MSIELYYWESDQTFHTEPEPVTQEKIIKVMEKYAAWSKGKNAEEMFNLLATPNDKLWEAIKERVVYLLEKNEHLDDQTLEPVIMWLDGVYTGINIGQDLG